MVERYHTYSNIHQLLKLQQFALSVTTYTASESDDYRQVQTLGVTNVLTGRKQPFGSKIASLSVLNNLPLHSLKTQLADGKGRQLCKLNSH